jgi:hypothetical protein
VANDAAVPNHDPGAGVIGRERLKPELVEQRQDGGLRAADPLATHLDREPVLERVADGAPTHSVARFQHPDRATRGSELPGGAQHREAGTDHHHVNV